MTNPEMAPVAWMITVEKQDGSKETYPASGRYKDVLSSCDFEGPVPLFTEAQLLEHGNARYEEGKESLRLANLDCIDHFNAAMQDLTIAQADNARLRELMKLHMQYSSNGSGYVEEALSIPLDSSALREHDAKLVEKIAIRGCQLGSELTAIADKIRKGEL